MAVDIWQLNQQDYINSIADQLAKVTSKEGKEESGWSLLKSLIVPIAASVLLPGIGTALGGTFGSMLAGTGGATGILKTLGGIGLKTLGTAGISKLTDVIGRGVGAGGETGDIKLDDPLGFGKSAVKKTKGYLEEAIKGDPMKNWGQSLLQGVMMQGPGALWEAGKVGWTAPKAATTANVLSGVTPPTGTGGFQPSSITEMMGGKQSPMAQLGSGKMGLQQAVKQATPVSQIGRSMEGIGTFGTSIYPTSPLATPKLNMAEGLIKQGVNAKEAVGMERLFSAINAPRQAPDLLNIPSEIQSLPTVGKYWKKQQNIADKLAYLEMLKGRK